MRSKFWRGWQAAHRVKQTGGPGLVVIDMEGTLTDGRVNIGADGRTLYRSFSSEDADALGRWQSQFPIELLSAEYSKMEIIFAEARQVHISKAARNPFDKMGEIETLGKRYSVGWDGIVYIGAGYYDFEIMPSVAFGIATANARDMTRRLAHAVTQRAGGDGAVAEALDYLGLRLRNAR